MVPYSFTQWSGNTLISYYLGKILTMIGMTDKQDMQRINLGIAAWSLICGTVVALLVRRFRRRVMYLTCTISLMCVYIAWTVSMERAMHAVENDYTNNSASIATIFFIYAYSPAYNIGYNALTYTYLVELWPFALRSRGITFFQLFGRLAGFFTTFVNPIGMDNEGWRYLIFYCVWLGQYPSIPITSLKGLWLTFQLQLSRSSSSISSSPRPPVVPWRSLLSVCSLPALARGHFPY